jgi:hypothetical protein
MEDAARAIAIPQRLAARLSLALCATALAFIPVAALADTAACKPFGTPLVWNAGHPCSAEAQNESCRLALATANSGGGSSSSIIAAALPLAQEYDAAAARDRSLNLAAAATYLIAAVSEVQTGLLEQGRLHYQAALARIDAAPRSAEGQCARLYAAAGLEQIDAQQLRTRWIAQYACGARNQNDDQCALARYSANPSNSPGQAEIDVAHRLAKHYKGFLTFDAQLAARAFTIAAQFETRAGRLKEAHFDTLSALALGRVPSNRPEIARLGPDPNGSFVGREDPRLKSQTQDAPLAPGIGPAI